MLLQCRMPAVQMLQFDTSQDHNDDVPEFRETGHQTHRPACQLHLHEPLAATAAVLGLILAQWVYVYHFWVELSDLIGAVMGNAGSLAHILDTVAVDGAPQPSKLTETTITRVVPGLIDVVMISNLLIMVIVGGYKTFVSRMNLEQHPDQPEWLSHVNATVLKVKLGTAIIGISSIHFLKTFVNARAYDEKTLLAQTGIHLMFLISALAIAYSDRIMAMTANADRDHH
jgi:uncharacterized protein (TIGR00645 family)